MINQYTGCGVKLSISGRFLSFFSSAKAPRAPQNSAFLFFSSLNNKAQCTVLLSASEAKIRIFSLHKDKIHAHRKMQRSWRCQPLWHMGCGTPGSRIKLSFHEIKKEYTSPVVETVRHRSLRSVAWKYRPR